MKRLIALFALFTLIGKCGANEFTNEPVQIEPIVRHVISDRGGDYRVWQKVTTMTNEIGDEITTTNAGYMELATGMHFQKDGQWVETREEILPLEIGGAAATNGQHQVYFPSDIYQGVIEIVTPDGRHLQSRPLGISYFDGSNSVLIAVLTNSVGQILPSGNQVIYTNAFTDFAADLICTYRKGGFECDLIFREQPPGPQEYALNPETSRLQLLTEFFNTTDPVFSAAAGGTGNSLPDATLKFGAMAMVRGKAYLSPDSASVANAQRRTKPFATGASQSVTPIEIPVSKTWTHLEGRTFLIEEVPLQQIASQLQLLPAESGTNHASLNPALRRIGGRPLLPPRRVARAGADKSPLARAGAVHKPGVVLDYYITVSSDTNNLVLRGDTTYFISGEVNIIGGSLTVEGGTVVKFEPTNSCYLYVESGTFNCQTAPYRPAVFTSRDDNTVGETLTNSTGAPVVELGSIYLATYNTPFHLHDVRMAYPSWGVYADSEDMDFSNLQFVHASLPLFIVNTNCKVRNVLMNDIQYAAFEVFDATISAEHLTLHQVIRLGYNDSTALLVMTNCLLVGVQFMPNDAWPDIHYTTNHVAVAGSNVAVFQTVGAGAHYLTNGSPYRNSGTTNISAQTLADLRNKTTYPPTVLLQSTPSESMIFSPQIPRDTNSSPDLGYHYDPIDYAVSGVSLNQIDLTVYPETVIAAFGTNGSAFGLTLGHHAQLLCEGLATNWNRIVAYNTVQEQHNVGWTTPLNGSVLDSGASHPSFRFRFTDWSILAQDAPHLSMSNHSDLALRDCQFHGGSLIVDYPYEFGTSLQPAYRMAMDPSLNNCLLERVKVILHVSDGSVSFVQNSLFWRGSFDFLPVSSDATVQNNFFDGTTIVDNSASASAYAGGYNAFVTNFDRLQPTSTNDIILTNALAYQAGPLGNYYQPTNSRLLNAGSTNADQLGLYDYTVSTNLVGGSEVKETNSLVDIGYHYVAVDSNAAPLSTYANGVDDYLVTSSTDAIPDWWEWEYFGNLDQTTNADYDLDGTNNLAEYQNSRDPNKIVFSFVVPNQYVTTNLIVGDITVLAGVPSSVAVLVDSTNFGAATWAAYTSSSLSVNLGTNLGAHEVWVGLRGRRITSQQTWVETTLILDSGLPTISITGPTNNSSLNTSRVNVRGTFGSASLNQIVVNGVLAFTSGTNFDALNVPLDGGTNLITATIENFAGVTNAASINVLSVTNSVDPVQLQATPVGGFAPLTVSFSIQTNLPGTISQVLYDFNGDDIIDLITNDLSGLAYTYTNAGQYFPVVTIQTTAGWFSSVGGWNSLDQSLRINVQAPAVILSTISVTDPVDIQWTAPSNLYVLSGSSATLTQFSTNGSSIRSVSGIWFNPSGIGVDALGNVYVAVTGSNQIWKFRPTSTSFEVDTNFGVHGCVGLTNGSAGTNDGEFDAPFDIAVSPDGSEIVVSDSNNNRIQRFDTNGVFTSSFGVSGDAVGQFTAPKGLAYDSSGFLYIVDSGNDRITIASSDFALGVSGTNGPALGQFDTPLNVSVGRRGVYVADSGNSRIQAFKTLENGVYRFLPSDGRFAFSTNFSQPAAVAAVENLTNEIFFVADTGNDRVVLCRMPNDNPTPAWTNMTSRVLAGDVEGAVSNFSIASAEGYRAAFLCLGTNSVVSDINRIGPLTPVFIRDDTAEYYFEQTIAGQLMLFPVKFIRENGIWKISEF